MPIPKEIAQQVKVQKRKAPEVVVPAIVESHQISVKIPPKVSLELRLSKGDQFKVAVENGGANPKITLELLKSGTK